MGKTYRKSKSLLLLSFLFFYWQDSTLSMDDSNEISTNSKKRKYDSSINNNENDISTKSKINRLKQENGESKQILSFDFFPDDIINHIFSYLNITKPNKEQSVLFASNKRLNHLIINEYEKQNKLENHYQWKDNDSLTPRALYAVNNRILTILGFFNNIKLTQADPLDRIRFERLCDHFLKTPFFSSKAIPVMYVEYLQVALGTTHPTAFQLPYQQSFSNLSVKKSQLCANNLSAIANQQNARFQNEAALYLHFWTISSQNPSPNFFRFTLNGSLMTVMNQNLMNLKNTPGLSGTAAFTNTWQQIIDQEIAVTHFQQVNAAQSNYNAGETETDPVTKAEHYAKAAKYYEAHIETIFDAGQKPTAQEYHYAAAAHYNAGNCAADPIAKAEYYAKAAKYYEAHIETIFDAGQIPTAKEYNNAAAAHNNAGNCAADPAKAEHYAKAAKYSLLSLVPYIVTSSLT